MYLNCHSWYSLRYGTMSVESLVQEALQHKVSVMALTDINNSTGIFEFVKACRDAGIKPIAGIDFRKENQQLYTLLAQNPQGFQQINRFLTEHNLSEIPLPDRAPAMPGVFCIYPFSRGLLPDIQNHEYTGIRASEVNKLNTSALKKHTGSLVIWHPVSVSSHESYELHRHLRAIDNNTLLSKLSPDQHAAQDEHFLQEGYLEHRFAAYPEIIENTGHILRACSFDMELRKPRNKKTFTGKKEDDKKLLEKLAREGLGYRYGKNNKKALSRLLHELEIIDRLDFSSYFLITWDIIRYSMSRGFYHVGRGSGANSVVAYCLRITNVDPIELNLQFERFLNPKRSSPPDFDIDYSWKERDEVLDYIFKRYGRDHTALLGTITTFQGRSVLRELGKVYGLPESEITEMVENRKKEVQSGEIIGSIIKYAGMMQDFPNHRSIHAGGVLISEEPITCFTALDLPPKGMPTVQWDMYIAEDIGFEKFDILSQRGIGHIKDAVELVHRNQRIRIDEHDIPAFKSDPLIRDLLRKGDLTGCFYVESPAMRSLLCKLHCDDYLTLVAASSIIRPGVARAGMMKQYIQNYHEPEKVSYLHPIMKEQLEETYGVMVYQEDVLKVCHHFAGLDLSDADLLRRAMSGKSRSKTEFQRIHAKFFSNCREFGYPEELTAEVWRQVESFAGYSFAKGHSASFAVESYQSMYLKAHFPVEFMVAVINNFGGFYHTWVYVHEARKLGGTIHLPCVNNSMHTTCLYGKDVYLGFIHVQNLESELIQILLEERDRNGRYSSLEDLIKRTGISLKQLIILIRTDALRFTGRTKKELLWEAHLLLNAHTDTSPGNELFYIKPPSYELPRLEHEKHEDAYDEIELLGFPVSMSYFDLLKTSYRSEVKAKDLLGHTGKTIRMLGNYVTYKEVRTIRGDIMAFGTFIDEEGNFFDTTHFSSSLQKYPFTGPGVYLILGKVVQEFGFPSLEVSKMVRLPIVPDERYL